MSTTSRWIEAGHQSDKYRFCRFCEMPEWLFWDGLEMPCLFQIERIVYAQRQRSNRRKK
jgi:hypothetical protein